MSFPDDYKRVQQPGGAVAVVEATLYLARQLAVNVTDWTLVVGDGSTPGGHRALMEENFNAFMQGNAPFGTKAYIEAGTDGLSTELARLWKASELYATFNKLADTSVPASWFIKDSAMPDVLRVVAKQIGDANSAVYTGHYRFDPATAVNLPAGIPASGPQHVMLVVAHSTQNVGQFLYLRDDTGRIFIRSQTDGVWGAWIQATGLTITDLNTRVAKAGDTMTGKLVLPAGTNARASQNIPDGIPPGTPVDGDIWRQDSLGGLMFRKGAASRVIRDSHNAAIAVINDTKANNVSAGASVANAWQTRNLNTEVYDPENIVTISANQFTVAYDCMCEWSSPAFQTKNTVTRLYNVTDGVVVGYGTSEYGDNTDLSGIRSLGAGVVVAGKTYRIDMWTTNATAINGLGTTQPIASAALSVYTEVVLRRL